MVERRLEASDSLPWRLPVGVLVGVASTVVLYGAIALWSMHTTAMSGSLREAVETTLVVLVWTVASASIGVVTGKLAGRLEVPVADGSGLAGLIVLGYLPDPLADPVVLLFSAIPFLIFVSVGGALTFFARRTDLR